jgi:hypothetical protein
MAPDSGELAMMMFLAVFVAAVSIAAAFFGGIVPTGAVSAEVLSLAFVAAAAAGASAFDS